MRRYTFVFTLLFFLFVPVHAQKIRFDHIGITEGLSNNTVYQIFQDYKGFLWFGTLDGLSRYDGYEIRVFRHSHLNTNTLSGNRVTGIYEDKRRDLWLFDEFSSHLSRFNPQTEKFYTYYLDKLVSGSVSNMTSVYEDEVGNMWAKTHQGQFFKYHPSTDTFIYSPNTVSKSMVALTDKPELKALTEAFDDFLKKNKRNFDSQSVGIKKIVIDKAEKFWIATRYDGLYSAERTDAGFTFISHLHQENDFSQVPVEEINDILEDKSGVIWIGTKNRGLYQYARDKYKFDHIAQVQTTTGKYNLGAVRAITEDKQGKLWIGTNDEGLWCLDRKTGWAVQYQAKAEQKNTLGHRFVRSLWTDPKGIIWVGHYGGFSRYNANTDDFTRIIYNSAKLPEDTRIYDFDKSTDETLWLAGWGVLLQYNLRRDTFRAVVPNTDPSLGLTNDRLREILVDPTGKIQFIASEKGISRFDTVLKRFVSYKFNPNDPQSLPSNNVFHVFQDSKKRIWIGTADGLAEYNLHTNQFTTFATNEGLPGALVFGILEDEKGYLWLSTTNGLAKFDSIHKKFRNYDVWDGLQSNEFLENGFFKTNTGEMIFGGVNGINIFKPEAITDNLLSPAIALTGLKFFNKQVIIGEKTGYQQHLERNITFVDELILSPEQRFFSIEFTALHFVNPRKNKFAYKLEGFDEDWIYRTADVRFASYTNLPPGNYIFHVKACNSDGIWNENGITLKITVQPPFYVSWWFFMLVGFGILLLAFWLYRSRIDTVKKQESIRAIQLESELNFLKSQVNPHFLFNTLNNIYALCLLNSPYAATMVGRLSDMMRYMIYDCNADRVSLQKEIEYLTNYMDLHKLKSDKELNVQLVIEGNPEKVKIVPLLLINFLENSFKHGDIHFNREGYIYINICVEMNIVTFLIHNSFRRKPRFPVTKESIGLANVKQRLNLLYPNQHSLKIVSNDTIFEVELKLVLA
ncbi:MAG: histidine kinase [Verrucomicrobia bacterium]|nr:histidine kinase [Cytophagales bacterium]